MLGHRPSVGPAVGSHRDTQLGGKAQVYLVIAGGQELDQAQRLGGSQEVLRDLGRVEDQEARLPHQGEFLLVADTTG